MTSDEMIKAAQTRVKQVFTQRPETALSTSHGTAEITDGLTCRFTQGEMTTIMDMPEIMGGDNNGPSPGFHARAAVAGCVAIGVKQAAASEDIHLASVRVALEMDFDDGAMFGLGTNSAAPLDTRLKIHVVSAASHERIQGLVDRVLEMDPFFLALRDAQSVSAEVVLNAG